MTDTTAYKTKLEDEKRVLETEMDSVGRRNPANSGDWEAAATDVEKEPDVLDQATALDEYQENAAVLSDLEARYNQVLAALARIEDGSYGICEVGGEEIEAARLDADPAAATCKAHMNA
jgi:RNA polymerase-binding transcription factor DksA